MKNKSKLSIGIGLSLLGIVLLSVSAYILKDRITFFNHSILEEGVIINLETSKRNSSTYYHPVISFQATNGSTYTFSSETGTNSSFDFIKGDTLMIRYIEEEPQTARIDSFLDVWSLPLALLIAGLVISLGGGNKIYKYFKKNKSEEEIQKPEMFF